MTTKFIQLNTLSGAMAYAMEQFLTREQADILHFQEAVSSPEGKSDFFDFLQDAEKATGLAHTFFSPMCDFMCGQRRVYFGNAILSRYPLAEPYTEFTNGVYKKNFELGSDPSYNNKNFQHAMARLPSGVSLNLVNYHGYNVKNTGKQGNDMTAGHCRRIADHIAALTGPVILSGDFNLAPEAPSLKPLNMLLENLCLTHNVQTTRNAHAPNMRTVDYIFVSKEITVRKFEVLPDIVSDHAALLLEFDV